VSRAWSLVRRHGPAVFGLLLLVGALYVVQREFRGLSWRDIRDALDATPPRALWLAFGWTLLAYAVLTIYDRLGSIYAGHPVSYARSSLASFCAYTLAHNLGFAAVSGAAVRYRFYAAWGLPPLAIAKIVAFTSLTFGLGAAALGGCVLVLEPDVVPGLPGSVPRWALQAIGLLLWGIVLAYVVLSKFVPHFTLFGYRIDLPGFRLAVVQVVLASVDVAITAAIFYALLPPAEGLSFLKFLGIYLAAYSAGIVASVPGGLGVFDGTILLALKDYLSSAEVIGALLLFRLYYYIVPLFVAGGLFVAFELGQRQRVVAPLARGPTGATGALEGPALAGLASLGAVVLLFIGALPPKPDRLAGALAVLGGATSNFAASVVGSLLLVACYGLLRRLAIAWASAIALLLMGALIGWAHGEPWWLIALFLLVAALLAAVRGTFYRHARLTAEPLSASTAAALAAGAFCALTLATVAYAGDVNARSWWAVVLSDAAPDSFRFAVGITAVLLLVAAARLLRPARVAYGGYDAATRARLAARGAVAPAQADGVVLDEAGLPAFAFLERPGIWLALGDPAGEGEARAAAIWRFRDLCEQQGVDPAFHRVGAELLRVYGDIGLTAFPLDNADGPPLYLACRAERDLRQLLPLLPV
jgi:phosphatidylglycerol lysyltransferase